MMDEQQPAMNGVNGEDGGDPGEPSDAHNFAVLCHLLTEGALLVMHDTFNRIHPSITLSDSLGKPEVLKVLKKLKANSTISQESWDKLYPRDNKPKSRSFNAILLGVLLRHVCHLTPPYPNGWEDWPVEDDTSLSADLARITCYRKLLASMLTDKQAVMPFVDFNKHFDSMCGVFRRLTPQIRLDINGIRTAVLDEKEQDYYVQGLVSWQHTAFGVTAGEKQSGKHVKDSKDTALTQSGTMGAAESNYNPTTTSQTALMNSSTGSMLGKQLSRTLSKRSLKDVVPSLSKEDMAKFERSILLKFQKRIVDTVHSEDVVGRLVQRSILTHENKNKINLATRNNERMKIVIELVSNCKKSGKAFDIFCDILKFKYKGLYDQLVLAKKAPFVQDKPDEVSLCADALRHHYQFLYSEYAPIPWYREARAPLQECYLTPYITDHQGRNLTQETIFEGHSRCAKPRRLLIRGQSGVGKSIMCRYLVNEWAHRGGTAATRFRMVFLLDLRRITSGVVDSVIEQCLPLSYRRSQEEVTHILQNNQRDILFILDGLEELSANDTEVISLIYKELYGHSNVLLTVNTNFLNPSLAKYFDTKLILMGLRKMQAEEMVKMYSKLTKVPMDTFSELVAKVASEHDTTLTVLGQNPLYCLCMCFISEMEGTLDVSTASYLIQSFVVAVQKLHCRENAIPIKDGNIPELVTETLTKLEEFAFESLLEQRGTFPISEVAELHAKTDTDLLSIIEGYQTGTGSKPVLMAYFCSRLIHEYLAASHLSRMEEEDRQKYLEVLATERHMRNTAVFFCGLLRSDDSSVLKDFFTIVADLNRKLWQGVTIIDSGSREPTAMGRRSGRVNDFKLCFDCLEECGGHPDALEVVGDSFPGRMVMRKRDIPSGRMLRGLAQVFKSSMCTITEMDLTLDHFAVYEEHGFLSLADSIERSPQLVRLRLGWRQEEILALFLANVFGSNQSIQCVCVQDEVKTAVDNISAMMWSNLRSACANMQSVRVFSFTNCDNPAMVTSAVRNSPNTLEELYLTGCTLDLIGSQELGTKIEKAETLKLLDLTGVHIKRPDFVYITGGIRLTKTLQELILADTNLDRDGMEALADALVFNNSLRRLDLSNTALTDASCQVIGEALATNQWLQQVAFTDCQLSEQGVKTLRQYKRGKLLMPGLAGRHFSSPKIALSREPTQLSLPLSAAS